MAETPQAAHRPRPLSPFLTVYRWTPTMATAAAARSRGGRADSFNRATSPTINTYSATRHNGIARRSSIGTIAICVHLFAFMPQQATTVPRPVLTAGGDWHRPDDRPPPG